MNDLISIIIPAFNAEKYIDFCVRKLEKQTYKNLEIILVDDGSTDSTYEICLELKKEFDNIKLIHQSNCGPGKARENGFRNSSGTYISFVDSDDYMDENAYEIIIDTFNNNETDIVQFGYYLSYPDKQIDKEIRMTPYKTNNNKDSYHFFLFQRYCTNYLCNKVFKKTLFESVDWPKLYYSEDYAILAQLYLSADKTINIEAPLYHYVQISESACNKPFNERKLDQINAGNFVVELTKNNYPDLVSLAYFWLATHSARLAEEASESDIDNKKEIVSHCIDIFKENFRSMKQVVRAGAIQVELDKTTKVFGVYPKMALWIKRLLK